MVTATAGLGMGSMASYPPPVTVAAPVYCMSAYAPPPVLPPSVNVAPAGMYSYPTAGGTLPQPPLATVNQGSNPTDTSAEVGKGAQFHYVYPSSDSCD